jgi:hypothetical protein
VTTPGAEVDKPLDSVAIMNRVSFRDAIFLANRDHLNSARRARQTVLKGYSPCQPKPGGRSWILRGNGM